MKRRQKRKHLEIEESQEGDEEARGMCWAACLRVQGMLVSLSWPEVTEEDFGEVEKQRSADAARSVSRVSVAWDSAEGADAHGG